MRIFYCDPGLFKFSGHHTALCKSLLKKFRARGLDPVVIGGANAEEDVREQLGVKPHFRFSPYHFTDGDPFCGWLNAFMIGTDLTVGDLFQIPDLRSDDVIYFTGARPAQIHALGHWIAALPQQQAPRVIVDLVFLPGLDLKEVRNGQNIWVTKDPRKDASAVFFRYAGHFLKTRNVSRIRFMTSARKLVEPYSILLEQNIGLLPSMPYDAPGPVHSRAGHRPITVAILGNQTYHKGYQFMPEVFEQLLRTRHDIRIIAHNSDSSTRQPDVSAAMLSLAASDSRLIVKDTPLGDDAYGALLDSCDLVICPYNPEYYGAVYSGVTSECFAQGIPIVVPGNTMVAKHFEIFGQSGTTFDAFNAPSVLDATQRALDGFDTYAAAAVVGAARWAETQGAGKYVDEILRVANEPTWG